MALILQKQSLLLPAIEQHLKSFLNSSSGQLPKLLDLSSNPLGVDGSECIAAHWLTVEDTEQNSVEQLLLASCSVGRLFDFDTGAYVLTSRGIAAIGVHGYRLISLDLAWNDLNEDSMKALVEGLLAVQSECMSESVQLSR